MEFNFIGNNESVWLVKRKDTGQYATVGGFVEVGEANYNS